MCGVQRGNYAVDRPALKSDETQCRLVALVDRGCSGFASKCGQISGKEVHDYFRPTPLMSDGGLDSDGQGWNMMVIIEAYPLEGVNQY